MSARRGTALFLFALALFIAPQAASAAQLWESYYTSYDGWPLPHNFFGASNPGCPPWKLLGCATPLPSAYFDAFATNNPSQKITSRVRLTGPSNNWTYDYLSSGSISVTSGTDITLEWACQDSQSMVATYSGQCVEFWPDDTCKRYASQSSAAYTFYPYHGAEGSGFTASGTRGTAHVAPTVTTTYALRCTITTAPTPDGSAPGYGYGGNTPPTTAWQNFTVTVTANPPTDPCPSTLSPRPENIWGYLLAAFQSIIKLNLSSRFGAAYNFCLTNTGGNHFFIPTQTQVEVDSFLNAINANPGFGIIRQ